MGSFYSNVTILGAKLDAVQAASPRPAFLLCDADADAVVVFAEADDEGSSRSGQELSAALGCVAVSVAVHDDDILLFEVHEDGRSVLSGAVPDPADYFGLDTEMLAEIDPSTLDGLDGLDGLDDLGSANPGNAPDAEALVRAAKRGDVESVREALGGDFVFATDRHEALASALGLPRGAVGWGFRYLSHDDSGYSGPALVRI